MSSKYGNRVGLEVVGERMERGRGEAMVLEVGDREKGVVNQELRFAIPHPLVIDVKVCVFIEMKLYISEKQLKRE